ncbi:MAG: ATP-grasp domain-containing protein [Clostridiales bacterium]|nr:ATP-grasp domain-containing protein [Clostridiales bacterium]
MNKLRDITVLLTAAGSPSSPGLVQCLKCNGERNVRIIGVDMSTDPTIKQLVDEVYLVPAVSAYDYIDALLEICKKEKVDILIPGISQELPQLQTRRTEFEQIGTLVSVSSGEGLLIANDKIKLYQFMQENGFSIPNFRTAKNIDEFINACREIGYPNKPICVKMRDGSGSRGIRLIDPKKSRFDIFMNEKPNSFFTTYEDMLSILKETENMPELMVMDYLPGKEYSVDLLADNGKVLYMVGRESNVIVASIPQTATLTPNEKAYEISRKIVETLKLDGNIDLDFKFDENGLPQLMEINPRLAATLSVIAAGGVNLLYLRVKQLLHEKLPYLDVQYGVKLRRRYHELFCDEQGNPVTIG